MSRYRLFLLAAVCAVLLLVGIAGLFASSEPDGLERVAAEEGIDDVGGVDDDRLSGVLGGGAGVTLVLVLGGGTFWLLRRRDPDEAGSR